MSNFRRCSRPGCGKPAVATLTYAYAESTAVIGPLAPNSEPHSWDLCLEHAEKITAPLGWELVRVGSDLDDADWDDDDLTALAEAVREAGTKTSGLIMDPPPPGTAQPHHIDNRNHPVNRVQHKAAERGRRRAHLYVVTDESKD
ncbi:DUF3499 domain-containing protein [Corynebacterium epidermidicanis]|uniref:Putative DUF3499 family protein n=1 Tax=Corynebacterium epidermidicanis TaxID=1050174 RepID=A0A0G3GPK8_9CORY|nr:DUF3499 domain-containing protein [Corynebacterium epidermidicanis]AKK02525.1 putative DUF3499 family protein [Corynebacterium epidermidicanis]